MAVLAGNYSAIQLRTVVQNPNTNGSVVRHYEPSFKLPQMSAIAIRCRESSYLDKTRPWQLCAQSVEALRTREVTSSIRSLFRMATGVPRFATVAWANVYVCNGPYLAC